MSEQTKHTPGPWYLRTNRHLDSQGCEWGWIDASPPGGRQTAIPGVNVIWTEASISKANANLIAAAPDLLAVCAELVEGYAASDVDLQSLAREAEAAIAKARGETER